MERDSNSRIEMTSAMELEDKQNTDHNPLRLAHKKIRLAEDVNIRSSDEDKMINTLQRRDSEGEIIKARRPIVDEDRKKRDRKIKFKAFVKDCDNPKKDKDFNFEDSDELGLGWRKSLKKKRRKNKSGGYDTDAGTDAEGNPIKRGRGRPKSGYNTDASDAEGKPKAKRSRVKKDNDTDAENTDAEGKPKAKKRGPRPKKQITDVLDPDATLDPTTLGTTTDGEGNKPKSASKKKRVQKPKKDKLIDNLMKET